MRTFDFSPLYRSTVGFDRVFDMLNSAARYDGPDGWPPYNIEALDPDHFRITMAVAGFTPDDLNLTWQENSLVVVGAKKDERQDSAYLHRGIATRTFKQTFNLAPHVKVEGSSLENGLLTIELVREIPEALKPRRIEIRSAAIAQDNQPQQIETSRAA
jgi:molecular chaperone IbpA